jgi:energy-coupling factor transporter ATP-binding protein EcfA2
MELRKGHILPTVRIQKIELENFKSVRHGEIVFNCGRKAVEQDTESDILGIYGQNGSGKTSVIEALAILQRTMAGSSVHPRYSECIADGADFAKLTFVFDFQYPVEDAPYTRTITYSFKMEAVPNDKDEEDEAIGHLRPLSALYPTKVRIFDEAISASGMFGGEMQIKQDILTTFPGKYPIGPVRKIQDYVGENKDALVIDLTVDKRTAAKDSKSFIFCKDTMELFYKHSNYSEYFQILFEMWYYARNRLYVVDTRNSGIAAVTAVPFNTRKGTLLLNLLGSTRMSPRLFYDLEYFVKGINTVLPSLVADMELVLDHNEYSSGERNGQEVRLLSKRKDTIIPLRDESAGIIKLVSILLLVIAAYNDCSVTVAIDELDAGIYEYLLGEILTGLETYGKGQLIFTSHNLRPLEVLKKESLIFTTSNPDNRYIRLKGVGRTNNLRSLYLREILGNSQDEQIYDAAKRQKMIAAFMKAGKAGVENAEEE